MRAQGRVSLVGAGPGHPWLLTLFGKKRLQEAETVLYDRLVNPEILKWAPQAEKEAVGKTKKQSAQIQQAILSKMVALARQGKKVVRLKGGDPFLLGRGGEEALFLQKAKVSFEIIPGVSSTTAVPALAGIPLTHRELSHSVAFFTGHTKKGFQKDVLPIADTLIGLMSVETLPYILEELKSSWNPSTPAALIQWGTYPYQKVVTGQINNLLKKKERFNINPPALLVVGKVVSLRKKLASFEKLPLFGKRVCVLRSETTSTKLSDLLEEQGAIVSLLPIMQLKPKRLTDRLKQKIQGISKADVLTFTSQNGVSAFFALLSEIGLDSRALASSKIAAVGVKTAEALQIHGIQPDIVPRTYTVESMLKAIARGYPQAKVLMVRGTHAHTGQKERSIIPTIQTIYVYDAKPNKSNLKSVLRLLEQGKIDCLPFTSAKQVEYLLEFPSKKRDVINLLRKTKLYSLGPMTSQKLKKYGILDYQQPKKYTLNGLVGIMIKKGG